MKNNSDLSPLSATYTCENLVYTRGKLIRAVLLFMLGFFIFHVCIAFIPAIMPLKLGRELGASNKTIVLIVNTIGAVLNFTVCPMVSFQSDRYRSRRWGRRIPFILFTLPMLVASWILFAFVDSEAAFLSKALGRWVSIAPVTMTVILIAFIMLMYQFFYMYVGSVIHYIYNDIIPAQFLARVVGAIQVTTACSSLVFNFFIFKYGLSHFRLILLCMAAAYTLGVGAMCLFLKEPRFPDPPPLSKAKKGIREKLAGIPVFFREGFSSRIYLFNYLGTTACGIGGSFAIFLSFIHLNMGLSMKDIGNLSGTANITGIVISFLVALGGTILIDRWHPVRVQTILLMFSLTGSLESCRWIFFSPGASIYWQVVLLQSIILQTVAYFQSCSALPMLMRLFPKSHFGHLCSARALLSSAITMVTVLLLGALMDFLKVDLALGNYAYRFCYIWHVFFVALGAVFYICGYREFLKLGGFKSYRAPAPWSESGYEEMTVTEVVPASRKLIMLALNIVNAAMLLPVAAAVFFYFYLGRANMHSESVKFLTCALPAAAAALVCWLLLYWRIRRDCRRASCQQMPHNGIPHHGLLLLLGGTRLALMVMACIQCVLVVRHNAPVSPAWMLVFECIVAVIFTGLIWIYTRVERGASTEIAR